MSAQLSHRVASILKKIKVVSFRSDAQGFVPRGKAKIIAKMNSLCDPTIIRALYEASNASNKRGYYG